MVSGSILTSNNFPIIGDGPVESHAPTPTPAMPQPGLSMRRRSKGPALSRPAVTAPLEPPSEPKEVGCESTGTVPNPHEQLQLVAP